MKRGATLWPVAVGIGWRQPHYRDVMAGGMLNLDFLEVHTEDFLSPGGASRQLLMEATRRFPVSLHGVGLGLGSAIGVDPRHLQRVRALVDAVQPALVSEHAGFTRARHRHGIVHLHEPLPIPFSARGLSLLASQVDTVQQSLGRRILIENLGVCLAWDEDAIGEPDFFNALAARTGCGLLLDLNSVFVRALNRGLDDEAALRTGMAWIDGMAPAAVGQYHVSGHSRVEGLALDDHGGAVAEPVWSLYRHALTRIGARPTLVEWDHALPSLPVLCQEVARARREQRLLDRQLIAPPPPRPSSRLAPSRPMPRRTARAAVTTASTAVVPGDSLRPARRDGRDLPDQQSGLVAALLAAPGIGPTPLAPVGLRALSGIGGGLPRALRLYQAHASGRAERALSAVYPRLRDRVEADEPGSFASLAWACWRRHPPAEGDLGEWGKR
ncbi:multinuclear nonheme iron-dependent oxidase [Roseateles chitinivorans]|uniref:multinuclear nonheme iron-dependent oxidase n=1 Tax=Roseateles chitinivorans TaxID=2917965 RepID=UPI003D66B9F5